MRSASERVTLPYKFQLILNLISGKLRILYLCFVNLVRILAMVNTDSGHRKTSLVHALGSGYFTSKCRDLDSGETKPTPFPDFLWMKSAHKSTADWFLGNSVLFDLDVQIILL